MGKAQRQLLLAIIILQLNPLSASEQVEVAPPKYSGVLSPDYCVYRARNIPQPIYPRHVHLLEDGCTVIINFEVKPNGDIWFTSSEEKDIFSDLDTISEAIPKTCRLRYVRPLMKALLKSDFIEGSEGASCNYKYVYKLEP